MLSLAMPYNFLSYSTLSLASTTGGASTTFTINASVLAESCLVYNSGTNISFVAFGIGSATAAVPTVESLGATPIPPGAVMALKKGKSSNVFAAINSSGTSTLYCTAGDGQ